MPTERNAAPLAEFVKFKRVGWRVLGRITRFDTNDNGAFVILHPALVKDPAKKEAERFDEIAVGLTADTRGKITPNDVGKMIVLGMVGQKESTKGNPTKLFKVFEVEPGENYQQVIQNDELFRPVTPTTNPDLFGGDTDDLPF